MRYKDVPADIKKQLPAKPLAIEALADGTYLAIYEHTGMIVGGRTWLWTDVTNGNWDGETRRFEAAAVDGGEGLDLTFGEDSDPRIAITIADRIDSSIVYSETVTLGRGWLRAYLRTNPDGTYFTQTVGADLEDVRPEVLDAVASDLEASVKEAAGLS